MSLDIRSITNEKMAQAAKAADSQGTNANNGNLDSNELSVFIQQSATMKCSASEILKIVKKVGVEKNDTNMKDKVKILKEIKHIEQEIESKNRELEIAMFGHKRNNKNEKKNSNAADWVNWIVGNATSIITPTDYVGVKTIQDRNYNSVNAVGDLRMRNEAINAMKTEILNLEREKQALISSLFNDQ